MDLAGVRVFLLRRRYFVLAAVVTFCGNASAFEHHHALGIGYHSGHIASDTSGSFHFRSFPVSYVGRLGGDWAAHLRVAMLFPLRARQGALTFSPAAEYDRTQVWDSLVGATHRFTRVLGFELETGAGAHFHYVRYQSTTYVEWSSAALGLGLSANARRSILPELWGRPEMGVGADLSYDFIDLSRGGDLSGGVQGQLLVFLGGAWGAPP